MKKYNGTVSMEEVREQPGRQKVIDRAVLPEVVYNHAGVDIRTFSAGEITLTCWYFQGVRIPAETASWCVSRYNRTGRRASRLEVYYHMHPEKTCRLAAAF